MMHEGARVGGRGEGSAGMPSIIVPAYNAERTIGRCLDALMRQDYAGDYEVIVVDDGSTDATPDIVAGYEGVRLVRQPNAGPAVARNRGASEARGDIILFTDSDCVPEEDWVSEMLRPFGEADVVGVKGRYKTGQKEITARFVQIEYEDKYAYMLRGDYIDFIDTYSAGFRRDVFIGLDGYDPDFPVACAEDVELSYRLSRLGYKMVFNPDAVVYHLHPDRLGDYLRKKYKFAYWRVVAVRKNPDKLIRDSHTPQVMKLQLLFPPALLAGTVFAAAGGKGGLAVPALLLLLFLCTTVPFASRAIRKDFAVGLLSPVLLFLRASAQFLGVAGGLVRLLGSGGRT